MERNITLYTIHCPQCKILKSKLDAKGVKYIENSDKDEMLRLGMATSPVLSVDGKLLRLRDAIDWVKEYNAQEEKQC